MLLCKAYTTYVRPLLESCTTVWSPHLKQDIKLVESVQRNFTWRLFKRCGLGHPSYNKRCEYLKLDSLELRRFRNDLVMVYKIVYKKIDLNFSDFFDFCKGSMRTRGHSKKLFVTDCKSTARKNFFSRRVVKAWNKLPENVISCKSIENFRNELVKLDLNMF